MENLKIKVNSESESKEVQELFFELGYTWSGDSKDIFDFDMPEYIVNWNNGYITVGDDFDKNRQEITLPELRDLVVLKRNSIDDATHEDKNDPEFKYRLIDNHWYVITEENPVWRKDSIDLNEAPLFIKPIEKPMKEYLIKSGDGKYLLTHHDSIGAIEIPDGATYYAKDASLGKSGNFFFRLRSDDFDFEAVWLESNWIQAIFNVENQDVLWQRNNNQTIASAVESSHPEEPPFIDDEPKYTDAEVKYMDENGQGRLPSLNDQYAEIEKVRQSHRTASEIADSALKHIRERAETYDQPTGERSAAKTAKAFNAITGKDITESEVWLLLQLLKDVRQWSREDYHQDSAEDCIAYASLKAESLEGGE